MNRTAECILHQQRRHNRKDGEQDHACLDLFVFYLEASNLCYIAAPE